MENNNLNNGGASRGANAAKIAKMGMLIAIAVVLVYFIHFPLLPMLPFMEYDPADVSILIGTFAFGPIAGLVLTVITALVQGLTVSASSGVYGIIMHIISTGAYVLAAGIVYKLRKTKRGAIVALAIGIIAVVAIMVPANMFITPVFMGAPREAIVSMMPFIMLFNFIKSTINAIITFLLYKRISGFLHGKGGASKKTNS